jgi:hypothetical protein
MPDGEQRNGHSREVARGFAQIVVLSAGYRTRPIWSATMPNWKPPSNQPTNPIVSRIRGRQPLPHVTERSMAFFDIAETCGTLSWRLVG